MCAGNEARRSPTSDGPQWAIEELDLEAYLDRIDIPTSVGRSEVDTLVRLHRHHVDTFPFENIDHVLGTPVDVCMRGLNAKLVRRRRGGHCVELNLLFAAALERLGYVVTRRAARVVVPGRESARSHAILQVAVGDSTWLADTAFSSGLLAPLPLRSGDRVDQGGKTYEVEQEAHGEWVLRVVSPDMRDLYRFREEHLNWFDFDMIARWGEHSPASPISGGLFVTRRTEKVHMALRGTTFTTTDRAGNKSVQDIDAPLLPKLLQAKFGIQLTGDETAALIEKLLVCEKVTQDVSAGSPDGSAVPELVKEEVSVR